MKANMHHTRQDMCIANFFLDIKMRTGVYIKMFYINPIIAKGLLKTAWLVRAVAEEVFY